MTAGHGQIPAMIDEMIAGIGAVRGFTAAWREYRSLAEFLQQIREWKLVKHGLSDVPWKFPIYRRADTIPRSVHIREAAHVRNLTRIVNAVFVRFDLGWMQTVSRSSVGELVKRIEDEFHGTWDTAEL